MNKFFSLLTLAVLMCFAVASCGDDDEKKPEQQDVVAPVAKFTATPETQTQPSMNVCFYVEKVEGEKIQYRLDFGDGVVIEQDNSDFHSEVVHAYSTYGEYTATLTVTNADDVNGASDKAEKTISILPSPPLTITVASRFEGIASFTLHLDPGVMYTDSVKWDIKSVIDGTESSVDMFYAKVDEDKSYIFENPGTYLLYITGYGPGAKDGVVLRTDSVYVQSEADVLKANFVATPLVQSSPSMNVNFYVDKVWLENVSYHWDFGDGKTAVWLTDSDFRNVLVHTYDTYGEYTVTLRVKNSKYEDLTQCTVKILPSPPYATRVATRYEGIAPYMLALENSVRFQDSVRWDVKRLLENEETKTEGSYYVHDGKFTAYSFEEAGTYLLDLTAYGPGAPDGLFILTDTVYVSAPTPASVE